MMTKINSASHIVLAISMLGLSACGGGSGSNGDGADVARFEFPDQPTTVGEVFDQGLALFEITRGREDVEDIPTTGDTTLIGFTRVAYDVPGQPMLVEVFGQTTLNVDFAGNDVTGTADNFVVSEGFGVNPEGLGSQDPALDRDQPVISVDGSLVFDGEIRRTYSDVRGSLTGDLVFTTPDDREVLLRTDAGFGGNFQDDGGLAGALGQIGASSNDTMIFIDGVDQGEFNVLTFLELVPE